MYRWQDGSWFSLGALPFTFEQLLTPSLFWICFRFFAQIVQVTIYCAGSHYRFDKLQDVLFQLLSVTFFPFFSTFPTFTQSGSLSLSLSLWKGTKLFLPEGCFFPPVYFFNILFRLEVSSLPFFLLNKPCHLPCGGYSGIQLQYKICTYTR